MELSSARDDVVYYQLYCDDTEEDIDALRQTLLSYTQLLTRNHIWQQDGFSLTNSRRHHPPWPSKPGSRSEEACLWGEVCYGDNIEDEWLIVWLLVELSKRHKVSMRVWDSDGDFLLIHAAYALPKWLKPDVAENRVWIRDGKIHLIPLPSMTNPTIPPQPTIEQALQILRSETSTVAPSPLQACIAAKLAEFPEKLTTNIHQAAAILPARLASVLQQEPQLIAPAVLSFYYRDPEDIKAARTLPNFPPNTETVQSVVAFSRCLYAQMASQQFQPPRSLMLPLPSDPLFPAAIMGAKITAGFEMLLASLNRRNNGGDPLGVLNASKRLKPQWEAFLKRLDTAGFFCGEMEGSAKYKSLLQKAAEMFHSSMSHGRGDQEPEDPAQRCADLLAKEQPFNPQALSKAQSDAWLAEGKMELERELHAREAESKETLSAEFQSFLEKDSEIEGVNTVEELFGKFSRLSDEDQAVDFDSESFLREMQQALNLGPDRGDASSEEGSSFYGGSGDEDEDWGNEVNLQDFSDIDSILQNSRLGPGLSPEVAKGSKPRDGKRNFQQFVHPETQPARPATQPEDPQADWEARTASDSDDAESQEGDAFDEAYEKALRAGYREHQPPGENGMLGEDAGNEGGDDLTPVDLDLNLMQNLLSSYKAQEGLSGPAGNLAGLLGLNMHPEPNM